MNIKKRWTSRPAAFHRKYANDRAARSPEGTRRPVAPALAVSGPLI